LLGEDVRINHPPVDRYDGLLVIRLAQVLLRRKIRYKFKCKIEVNKLVIQLFCPVPAVCTDFFKFTHIAFDSYVNLLNGFLLDVLVFDNKILNHYRIQNKDFQPAEDVGMVAAQISSDLGQAGKYNADTPASMIRLRYGHTRVSRSLASSMIIKQLDRLHIIFRYWGVRR